MRKAVVSCVVCIVGLLCQPGASGGEGAIPVWEPTTIREPGYYVVTRNITSAESAITIDSDDVTLDLKGFLVESTGSLPTITATGKARVTIRNGVVEASGTRYTIEIQGGGQILIEKTRSYSGGGFRLENVDDPVVRDNVLTNSSLEGIWVSSTSDQGGVIEENQIEHTALAGILVDEGNGLRISRNVLSRTGALFNDPGIRVDGHGCILRDNLVNSGYGPAISITGDRNHVEGNVLIDNNSGLSFTASAEDNIYRGNTARGNTPDLSDSGTGNTSHGDNYMPNQL